jgi:hypothetical protein
VNAVALIYVNQHLESLRAEAQDRRLASLAGRRTVSDRLASAATELRRVLGIGDSGSMLPKLENYPYGG